MLKLYRLTRSRNSSGESVKQIVEDDGNASKIVLKEVCLFKAGEMEFEQVESSVEEYVPAGRHVNIVFGTRNFSLVAGSPSAINNNTT